MELYIAGAIALIILLWMMLPAFSSKKKNTPPTTPAKSCATTAPATPAAKTVTNSSPIQPHQQESAHKVHIYDEGHDGQEAQEHVIRVALSDKLAKNIIITNTTMRKDGMYLFDCLFIAAVISLLRSQLPGLQINDTHSLKLKKADGSIISPTNDVAVVIAMQDNVSATWILDPILRLESGLESQWSAVLAEHDKLLEARMEPKRLRAVRVSAVNAAAGRSPYTRRRANSNDQHVRSVQSRKKRPEQEIPEESRSDGEDASQARRYQDDEHWLGKRARSNGKETEKSKRMQLLRKQFTVFKDIPSPSKTVPSPSPSQSKPVLETANENAKTQEDLRLSNMKRDVLEATLKQAYAEMYAMEEQAKERETNLIEQMHKVLDSVPDPDEIDRMVTMLRDAVIKSDARAMDAENKYREALKEQSFILEKTTEMLTTSQMQVVELKAEVDKYKRQSENVPLRSPMSPTADRMAASAVSSASKPKPSKSLTTETKATPVRVLSSPKRQDKDKELKTLNYVNDDPSVNRAIDALRNGRVSDAIQFLNQ